MPAVVTADHPLVAHRLATLRDRDSPNAAFRTALSELSMLLVYEATRTVPTTEVTAFRFG